MSHVGNRENDFKGIEHFSKEDQEKIKTVRLKAREIINIIKSEHINAPQAEDFIDRLEPRHINTPARLRKILEELLQETEADLRLSKMIREISSEASKENKVVLFGQNIKNAIRVLKS